MKYRVLKPEFATTGERTPEGKPFFRVTRWIEVGKANSMAEAKRFHPAPVLEAL